MKKLLAIGCSGCVLLMLIGVIGGGLWWRANKGNLVAMGTEANEEGAKFGSTASNDDCVTEAISRDDACDGLMCEVKVKLFFKSCMAASKPTDGFCDGVPKSGAIMASAKWAVATCQTLKAEKPDRCGRLIEEQEEFCHPH